MKKTLLWALAISLMLSLTACGKSEAAQAVDAQIAAIGEVTLESEETIRAAEEAVEGLTEEDRGQLDNVGQLEQARSDYEALVLAGEVSEVEAAISAIDTVTMENADAVDAVRALYNGSEPEVQSAVSNLAELEAGCFILPYLGQDSTSTWLRLVYNYTGDDWVFFEKVLMNIDGEQRTESFNYFDIVRDNGGGRVWEYIDVEVSNSDIDWLWDIANSTETIIRFQGDDYSHDMTVSDTDKAALRDCLTVYEALQ